MRKKRKSSSLWFQNKSRDQFTKRAKEEGYRSRSSFKLKEIVKAIKGKLLYGNPYLRVNGISIDSRTIKRGELFIAIKGNRFDGHNFIQQAINKGTKAIIIQDPSFKLLDNRKIPCVKVKDTRRALADLARFHRRRFNIPIIKFYYRL